MVRAALEVRLKTSGCTKSRIPAPNRLVRARATSEVTNHSSKMPSAVASQVRLGRPP